MLPELPPKEGAQEEAGGAGEEESSCLSPLPTSDLPLTPYPLRPTCSPHAPYIPYSQPHPPSSEYHVYEFLLTLDLKNYWGDKTLVWNHSDEESLRGIANQDFL